MHVDWSGPAGTAEDGREDAEKEEYDSQSKLHGDAAMRLIREGKKIAS